MAKRNSMRGDLDAALAGVRLGTERKAAILAALEEENMSKKQRSIRTLLIAAALCAALAATALALSPTLRDALGGLLGDFAPYARTVEGVSATDQGIQITVLKTIADETDGRCYLEVKDLSGDRLDKDTMLVIKGTGTKIKAYDPENRTALLEARLWKDMRNEDGTATLNVTKVWGCRDFSGIPLPRELLEAGNVLESYEAPLETAGWVSTDLEGNTTYGDTTVLVPNQTPMALEGTDDFTLSSMGYDKNGKLHIQIALAEGQRVPEWSFYPWFYQKGGTENHMAFGLMGHNTELEGGRYVDFRIDPYEDEPLTAEQFQNAEATMQGTITNKPKIEGEWTLTFPLDILPERSLTVDQVINNKQVKRITLSVTGLYLEGTYLGGKGTLGGALPAAVYLADGSKIVSDSSSIEELKADRSFANRWSFDDPVDPAQVVGISIGAWYMPLDGDCTLPGRWLPED